jgi:hypothetical protein
MEEFDALMILMNNVNFMDEVELELQDILAHTSDLEQMVIVYIISHLFAHVPRIRPDYSAAISLVGLKRSQWRCMLSAKHDGTFYRYLKIYPFCFDQLCNEILQFVEMKQISINKTPNGYSFYDPIAINNRYNNRMMLVDLIGAALMYLYSKSDFGILSLIFGLTTPNFRSNTQKGICILYDFLLTSDKAKINIPSAEYRTTLANLVSKKYPTLQGLNVWATVDGCKLDIKTPVNPYKENACYNGWLHKHCINNVLIMCMDGLFAAGALNYYGHHHDSSVALLGHIYDSIPTNHNIAADSAFAKVNGIIPIDDTMVATTVEGEALRCVRQASEWAMGIFQIPRLRTKLPVDDVKRGRLIHLSLLMNNYKVRCGIPTQVTTTFVNNNI